MPVSPAAGRGGAGSVQPPGGLLSELREQQRSIEAEMRALQAELDRALEEGGAGSEAASAAPRSPSAARAAPAAVRSPLPPAAPISAPTLSPARPAALARWMAPAVPSPPQPCWPAAERPPPGQPPGAPDREVWDAPLPPPQPWPQPQPPPRPLAPPAAPAAGSPQRPACGTPARSPRREARQRPLEGPRSPAGAPEWDNSTRVVHDPPQRRRLGAEERPAPLSGAPRPKSPGFWRRQHARARTGSPAAPQSPARAAQRRPSPGGSAASPSVQGARGPGVRRSVRSRSPPMDLVSRPPKYFEQGLSSCGSQLGGQLMTDSPECERGILRGELSPSATRKGGLWPTTPCSIRQASSDAASRRRSTPRGAAR
eukprot:TRINITY_DN12412_c0_g1_i1.p3 TRINITY_DN12412_c0_g1~~TRINITY_DN12412_c0_g1_i1.p3  ORF type:complete len:434 (+),score=94.28 TRINITY_DN12412_c0_g1_i1:195-1304(+)